MKMNKKEYTLFDGALMTELVSKIGEIKSKIKKKTQADITDFINLKATTGSIHTNAVSKILRGFAPVSNERILVKMIEAIREAYDKLDELDLDFKSEPELEPEVKKPSMTRHIMIDIETLGKKDNAVILSIGAVCFDGKRNIDEFYTELDVQEQINAGRSIDADTLRWWMSQDTAVPFGGDDVKGSLAELHFFIHNQIPEDSECRIYIWAHGVTFDITKLQSLFAQFYDYVPWEYWQIMDCRTLSEFWPESREACEKNNHNALEDAKNQVEWLCDINEKLDFL
jgi:hypothetical protein